MNKVIPLLSFVWENELQLDKAVYFTVIIGQLTIFGIFLTFMQFVASLNGDRNIQTYLGQDLKHFYIMKKLKFYQMIKSRWFLCLLMLSILLKPFLTLFQSMINTEVIRVLLFNWYVFSVIYLLLFVYSFFECVTLSISFKDVGQGSGYSEVLCLIEQDFFRNKKFERKVYNCDRLAKEVDYILYEREKNSGNLDDCYQRIISKLIDIYTNKKQQALFGRKKVKEYQAHLYIFQLENEVLDHLMFVFIQDREFLLRLSQCKLALINIYYKKYHDKEWEQAFTENDGWYNPSIWKIYEEIYKQNKDVDLMKEIVKQLDFPIYNKSNPLQPFQKEMRQVLTHLLFLMSNDIYMDNLNEQQLVDIFTNIYSKEYYQQMMMREISGRYVSNETLSPNKILNLLDEKHQAFILVHSFFFTTIYDNYSNWMGQSFNHWKKFLPRMNEFYETLQQNKAYLLKELTAKMDMHRFYPDMLDKLIGYLKCPMSFALMEQIEQDRVLSSYLMIPLRLCTLNESLMYPYQENIFEKQPRMQIKIVKYLADHPEFLVNRNVQEMIYYLRFELYQKEDRFLEEFEQSLSYLILTDVPVTDRILLKWRKDNKYVLADLAKYMLVKITDQHHQISSNLQEWVFKFIMQDFIGSDKSVIGYVEDINTVYERYHFPLKYFQMKKMMWLLEQQFNK